MDLALTDWYESFHPLAVVMFAVLQYAYFKPCVCLSSGPTQRASAGG